MIKIFSLGKISWWMIFLIILFAGILITFAFVFLLGVFIIVLPIVLILSGWVWMKCRKKI